MSTKPELASTSVGELKLQLEHPSSQIIWERALEVFGDKTKARRWMNRKRAIFAGHSPKELSNSGDAVQQRKVLEALISIDYGMYT